MTNNKSFEQNNGKIRIPYNFNNEKYIIGIEKKADNTLVAGKTIIPIKEPTPSYVLEITPKTTPTFHYGKNGDEYVNNKNEIIFNVNFVVEGVSLTTSDYEISSKWDKYEIVKTYNPFEIKIILNENYAAITGGSNYYELIDKKGFFEEDVNIDIVYDNKPFSTQIKIISQKSYFETSFLYDSINVPVKTGKNGLIKNVITVEGFYNDDKVEIDKLKVNLDTSKSGFTSIVSTMGYVDVVKEKNEWYLTHQESSKEKTPFPNYIVSGTNIYISDKTNNENKLILIVSGDTLYLGENNKIIDSKGSIYTGTTCIYNNEKNLSQIEDETIIIDKTITINGSEYHYSLTANTGTYDIGKKITGITVSANGETYEWNHEYSDITSKGYVLTNETLDKGFYYCNEKGEICYNNNTVQYVEDENGVILDLFTGRKVMLGISGNTNIDYGEENNNNGEETLKDRLCINPENKCIIPYKDKILDKYNNVKINKRCSLNVFSGSYRDVINNPTSEQTTGETYDINEMVCVTALSMNRTTGFIYDKYGRNVRNIEIKDNKFNYSDNIYIENTNNLIFNITNKTVKKDNDILINENGTLTDKAKLYNITKNDKNEYFYNNRKIFEKKGDESKVFYLEEEIKEINREIKLQNGLTIKLNDEKIIITDNNGSECYVTYRSNIFYGGDFSMDDNNQTVKYKGLTILENYKNSFVLYDIYNFNSFKGGYLVFDGKIIYDETSNEVPYDIVDKDAIYYSTHTIENIKEFIPDLSTYIFKSNSSSGFELDIETVYDNTLKDNKSLKLLDVSGNDLLYKIKLEQQFITQDMIISGGVINAYIVNNKGEHIPCETYSNNGYRFEYLFDSSTTATTVTADIVKISLSKDKPIFNDIRFNLYYNEKLVKQEIIEVLGENKIIKLTEYVDVTDGEKTYTISPTKNAYYDTNIIWQNKSGNTITSLKINSESSIETISGYCNGVHIYEQTILPLKSGSNGKDSKLVTLSNDMEQIYTQDNVIVTPQSAQTIVSLTNATIDENSVEVSYNNEILTGTSKEQSGDGVKITIPFTGGRFDDDEKQYLITVNNNYSKIFKVIRLNGYVDYDLEVTPTIIRVNSNSNYTCNPTGVTINVIKKTIGANDKKVETLNNLSGDSLSIDIYRDSGYLTSITSNYTSGYTYHTGNNNTNYKYYKFVLKKDDKPIDEVLTEFVFDGKNGGKGDSASHLLLSNDMDSIYCVDDKVEGEQKIVTTLNRVVGNENRVLYDTDVYLITPEKNISLYDLHFSYGGVIPTILTSDCQVNLTHVLKNGNKDLVLTFTYASGATFTGDTHKFEFKYGDFTKAFKVNKTSDTIKYGLSCNPNSITVDSEGNLSVSSIEVKISKNVVGKLNIISYLSFLPTNHELKYKIGDTTISSTNDLTLNLDEYKDKVITAKTINVSLIKSGQPIDTQPVDTQTIPILKDGKKGDTGERGKLLYPAGKWDSGVTYYGSDQEKTPFVMHDDKYWVLTTDENISGTNNEPGIASAWTEMSQYEAIYTKLLVAENGLIGSSVYNGDYLFSQKGSSYKDGDKLIATPYSSFNKNDIDGFFESGFTNYLKSRIETGGTFMPTYLIDAQRGCALFGQGTTFINEEGDIYANRLVNNIQEYIFDLSKLNNSPKATQQSVGGINPSLPNQGLTSQIPGYIDLEFQVAPIWKNRDHTISVTYDDLVVRPVTGTLNPTAGGGSTGGGNTGKPDEGEDNNPDEGGNTEVDNTKSESVTASTITIIDLNSIVEFKDDENCYEGALTGLPINIAFNFAYQSIAVLGRWTEGKIVVINNTDKKIPKINIACFNDSDSELIKFGLSSGESKELRYYFKFETVNNINGTNNYYYTGQIKYAGYGKKGIYPIEKDINVQIGYDFYDLGKSLENGTYESYYYTGLIRNVDGTINMNIGHNSPNYK